MPSEFDVIQRYFSRLTDTREDVEVGIGDDCALLRVSQNSRLAVSIDTLVEGIHFARDTDPLLLGHKSLAVGLSDLAAAGATPCWATLALTLPDIDEHWLEAFSRGFSLLARSTGVQLVGGDTTRGPLSITVQVHGQICDGSMMLRSGASAGDLVYVTGTLGDAALGLLVRRNIHAGDDVETLFAALDQPQPRLAESACIRELATSCIDISDGLSSDLGHILQASGVGATLFQDSLPLSRPVEDYVASTDDWSVVLGGGDDYELCFTLPAALQQDMDRLRDEMPACFSRIGKIDPEPGLRLVDHAGVSRTIGAKGYDHFG